jgi:hypothetical protein
LVTGAKTHGFQSIELRVELGKRAASIPRKLTTKSRILVSLDEKVKYTCISHQKSWTKKRVTPQETRVKDRKDSRNGRQCTITVEDVQYRSKAANFQDCRPDSLVGKSPLPVEFLAELESHQKCLNG